MKYHSQNTDLYTTESRQLAVLVHTESQVIVAAYVSGRCINTHDGLSVTMANILYDAHIISSWYEIDYHDVVVMTQKVGQVRDRLVRKASAK